MRRSSYALVSLFFFFVYSDIPTVGANQLYGNCSTSQRGRLIWEYVVRRTPNSMAFQTADAQYGPTRVTISCIDVNSIHSIGRESGVAMITSGGVGADHVKFNFVTTRGNPIHVKVLVYGHRI